MCYKAIISFLCALISILYSISAYHSTEIIFRVKLNGNHDVICNVSKVKVNIKDGDGILVSVIGDFDMLDYASCSLENSNNSFLTANNFSQLYDQVIHNQHKPVTTEKSVRKMLSPDSTAFVQIQNATKEHDGKWNCTFLSTRHMTLEKYFMYNGKNYTKINCHVHVNVEPPPFVLDKLLLCYVILGIVGIAALTIIIGQCVFIRHLRRKVASTISKDSSLSHLERRPARNNDRDRYSEMPGQKRSFRKKREESGIYQSLENLRMAQNSGLSPPFIRHRPPMPLPSDDDDEHIYDDGQTLQNMFAPPIPPSVDTLPKYNSTMNLNKPVQLEEYDYPDRAELLTESNNNKIFKCRPGKKAPLPPPPRPVKPKSEKQPLPPAPKTSGGKAAAPMSTGGPGGASMMAELGSRLKSKKNNQQTPDSAPSVTHQTPYLQQPLTDVRRPEVQSELRTQNVLFSKKTKETPRKMTDALPLPLKPSHLRQETRKNDQNWPSEAQPVKPPNKPQRFAQEPQCGPSKTQDCQVFRPQNLSPDIQDRKPQNWSPESQGLQDHRPQNERPKPPLGLRPAPSKPLSKVLPNIPPNAARSPPISRVSPMVKETPVSETPALKKPAPEQEMIYQEMDEKHNSSDYDDEFDTYDDLKEYNFYNI